MKKIVSIVIILLMLCSSVFAADLKTALNVVEQASETKYLENDQGYFSKTIVDSNPSTGEVTIELKLENTKEEEEKEAEKEIVLVLDNSESMDNETNGKKRKELVYTSTINLVNKIFDNVNDVKIGIVTFSSETIAFFVGSENDAEKRLNLSNDKENVVENLAKIQNEKVEGGTNIAAGLSVGKKLFSEKNNQKIIILVTDGVPNADINGHYYRTYSDSNYEKVIENTKNMLKSTSDDNIEIVSLMTGVEGKEEKETVEKIFGTPQQPTVGYFYNIADTDLEEVISNNIFKDVMKIVQSPINTIKIVDYFPEDIIENFEFSYVGKPSVGNVTEAIDPETKAITWNIDTLKGEETATLRYKLKIKDMQNAELLNKTIATNEKVELTYKDIDTKDYVVTLNSSPKIQLAEVKEQEENKQPGVEQDKVENGPTAEQDKVEGGPSAEQDGTTATGQIPQTGVSMVAGISIVITLIALFLTYKKNKNYKDIK